MGTSQAAVCSVLTLFAEVGFACPNFPPARQVACPGRQLPRGGPWGAQLGTGPSVPAPQRPEALGSRKSYK